MGVGVVVVVVVGGGVSSCQKEAIPDLVSNPSFSLVMGGLLKRIPVRSHLITNRIGCHKQSGRPNYGYDVSPM